MQRLRSLVVLAFGASTLVSSIGAEPATTNRNVTLQECIQLALEYNLGLQVSRLGPEVSNYYLRSIYGAYDPTLGFALGMNNRTQSAGIDEQGRPFGSQGFQSLFFGGQGSFLGGNLPFGGTSYRIGFSMGQTEYDPPFGLFDTEYSADAALAEVRQPLMRDFWVDQIRTSIAINKENLKGSELDLRQQILNTLLAVEQAYYDLIFAREYIKVQQTALEAAERLLNENRKRVEVGAMAPLEEKSAEAQAAASRANLIAAQGDYGTRMRILKNLITDDYSSVRNVMLDPSEPLRVIPVSPQVQDSWIKGLTQRPDLELLRLTLRQKNIQIRYEKNQLYPTLDLVGSYAQSARTATGFGDAFEDIGSGRYPAYGLRMEFSMPIGNTSARNNLRATQSELKQALLSLKKQEQVVMVEIDNAIQVVRTSYERVGATKEAREFAKAAWEAEQKKLDNGKSTSYEVLLKQRDYIQTLSSEIQALTDYNKSLADLAFSEGSSLERHNLGLEVR